MSGALWAAAAWTLLISVWAWRDGLAGRSRDWLNRENVAILFALLGTVSIAEQTTADELLRDPVVAERMVRGALAALSLLISGPILVTRLRTSPPMRGYIGLGALTVYLGISLVTVLYSVAPLVTAAKAFELGAGLAAVCGAALASDGPQRLRRMVTFVVALEGALLATAVVGFFLVPNTFSGMSPYRPGFLTEATMGSPFASSNNLSATGAILATFALARMLEGKRGRQRAWWLTVIAVGTLGTLLASGRQGVIMLALGVFTLLWFQRRALFVTLIGPAVIGAFVMFWDEAFRVFARGQPQLLANLTGRLPWWEAALDAWAQHPWTGYGYGAGGRFVGLANIGRTTVSNVHSGYIEALVGVGLLGLLPLLVAVFRVISWAVGALRTGRDVPSAILIVPLLLHTSIDLGFGGWLKPDFVLLACLVGLADWWQSRKRAAYGTFDYVEIGRS